MSLNKTLVIAVDSEDSGNISSYYVVSHPSATIDDFKSDWNKALEQAKEDDPSEWSLSDVESILSDNYGYLVESFEEVYVSF